MEPLDFIDAELARIGQIATAGFFLAVRNKGTSPVMAFQTYPQKWIDQYTDNAYVLRDPITTWALTVGGTIRWSSPFLPDPFRIFRMAAEHGLRFGASVAHGPLGALTICSVARADRELTDEEIEQVKSIVIGLHDHIDLPKELAPPQRDILLLLADGGTTAQVAARLGVSEAAARTRIKQVLDAMFAPTSEVAVQRARDFKLL